MDRAAAGGGGEVIVEMGDDSIFLLGFFQTLRLGLKMVLNQSAKSGTRARD